jgi:hypothetical protein
MKNTEEIVKFAEHLVATETGNPLSFLQKTVLRESLCEAQKTYAQIAQENRYSENYIKQWVAPKLWQLLSSVLDEKVNKTNCRALLQQRLQSKFFLDTSSLDSTALEELNPQQNQTIAPATFLDRTPQSLLQNHTLESPEGQVPLVSTLYIDRDPIEALTYQEILQPGAFIRIKAPKKMGKTSLMARILAYGIDQGSCAVRLSLNNAGTQVFTSIEKLLRWFCATITRKLGLESKLDDYWDDEIGALVSCSIYFEAYLLTTITQPIILAIDELDQVFEYPDLARDFLALLRSWYEETKDISVWQKLRLVIVHSTDIYIPLDTNQSPFNVGLAIELPTFETFQVQELAKRHQLSLNPQDLDQLMALSGGSPYLIRLAFYYAVRHHVPLVDLLEDATSDAGIYSDHLQYQLRKLQQSPELNRAFQDVLNARSKKLEIEVAMKLRSLGLIHLEGDRAMVSCKLYQQYFEQLFNEKRVM